MAITIVQQPQSITFAGNIPDIIVETAGLGMNVKLKVGAVVLLSEYYVADASGRARVLIRDFVDEQLSVEIPTSDLFEQTKSWKTFTLEVTVGVETTSFDFTALKGGSSKLNLDVPAFLKEAWLTWQVQTKSVRDVDPEWLSYFAQYAAEVKVKAWFSGGATETITLHTLTAGKHYSINMNFSDIREEFMNQPIYIDVWVQNIAEAEVEFSTWQMRYVLSTEIFDYDDLFIFHNGLGGVDTIRFTGEKRSVNPIEVDSALFYDEYERDYQVNPKLAFEKNTGYFRSKEAMLWSQDFFLSLKRYLYEEEELIDIRLVNPEVNTQDIQLVSYDFTYGYTRQTRFLALFKKKSPLIDPIIIGPGDEEFYLPPAISDFPQLDDPTDALFPVQVPGTPGWSFVTWDTMLEYIYGGLPAVVHNETTGKQGGDPENNFFGHLTQAELEKVQNLEPLSKRVVDSVYTITSDTAGTQNIGRWYNDANELKEVIDQPIVFAGATDEGELRWDVMIGNADGTAVLLSGDESTNPIRPTVPPTAVVLFELIWNENGESTEPPTETPSVWSTRRYATAVLSNTEGKYAKIMEMDLGFAKAYSFILDYGAPASLAANKVGSLHVAFVTTEANVIHSPTVKLTTVGFSEDSDFVLVALAGNKAALYHKSTNYFMMLQWRVTFQNSNMSLDSFKNGKIYEELDLLELTHWPSAIYVGKKELTDDELAGIQAANSLNGANPVATMDDLGLVESELSDLTDEVLALEDEVDDHEDRITDIEGRAPLHINYASQAAMLAGQANQLEGYAYFDGTKEWRKLATSTGLISDYRDNNAGGGGGADANAVHYNAADGKTASEKAQARDNIGSESGAPTTTVIVSNNNNNMPRDTNYLVYEISGASRPISGWVAGEDGEVIAVRRASTGGIIQFLHENISSTDINRIFIPSGLSIFTVAGSFYYFRYSAEINRWVFLGDFLDSYSAQTVSGFKTFTNSILSNRVIVGSSIAGNYNVVSVEGAYSAITGRAALRIRENTANVNRRLIEIGNSTAVYLAVLSNGTIIQPRSLSSDQSIRRDEQRLYYPVTITTAGVINNMPITAGIFNYRITAATSITGIEALDVGTTIDIDNATGSTLTISHENAGSIAANRNNLIGAADLVIPIDGKVSLKYCSGSRYELVSKNF